MSTKTPDRIVELWPFLDEAARQELLDLAENGAATELDLTTDEEQLLARAEQDFEQGRTLTSEEYRASMSQFFDGLRAKLASRS